MKTPSSISRLLHHRAAGLAKGDPVSLPIHATTTFALPGDPDDHHFYARNGNPTVEAVEAEIGLLEDADAVLFPSGMAAIAAVFYAILCPGDRILCHADGYYNARSLLDHFFVPLGVTVETCPTVDMGDADLTGLRMILAETPSNPGLDVCDLAKLAESAKRAGVLLVVDNTTANPLNQSPLDLGADLTLMADTKAMAGHSDVLAGHVAGRDSERVQQIRDWRRLAGAVLSPFEAYLLHRGLETLELRNARQCANALALAEALSSRGLTVRYPGLSTDPSHPIAAKQMRAFGPILTLTLDSREIAEKFIADCPLLIPATSFGGTHSSAECRARWGDDVPGGFIRIACGVEPTEDLLNAVLGALPTR